MKKNKYFRFIPAALLMFFACTDLNVPSSDKIPEFWRTPAEIEAGIAPAYVWLRNYAPGGFGGTPAVYYFNETTTDEIIVPNRIHNWSDDGIWDQFWKHTWGPSSSAIDDGWLFIYGGVTQINAILESVAENVPANQQAAYNAELRAVRAFHYYTAIDLYGNVPISTSIHEHLSDLETKEREVVFEFAENELIEAMPDLTDHVDDISYGRATKWFAQAVLAKLYLNAEVFTGTPRWGDCIAACNIILNSNVYRLEPEFFDNFAINNEHSPETIFAIPFDVNRGLELFWLQRLTLHYQSSQTFGLGPTPCSNGLCSTVEFVNLFQDKDLRKKMFLIGQQYFDSKQYIGPIPDPEKMQYTDGVPLAFDPVITSFRIEPPKTDIAGARCAKWEFNRYSLNGNMSNDFAIYRLADIILMKAEAQFRNGDPAGALTTLNQKYGEVSIRSRTGLPDFTASDINLDSLLAERARELAWEGHRRNDLIRFGHFTDARIPEKAVSPPTRNLFPIPQVEIEKNGRLRQNPGY